MGSSGKMAYMYGPPSIGSYPYAGQRGYAPGLYGRESAYGYGPAPHHPAAHPFYSARAAYETGFDALGHPPSWRPAVYDDAFAPPAAAAPASAKGKGTIATPRNQSFSKMAGGYLFPVIGKKKREFAEKNPDVKLVSLGVGDTTHPLPKEVTSAMAAYAEGLSEWGSYEGYDPKFTGELQEAIVASLYTNDSGKALVDKSEVLISDGSKCDLGRLQFLFDKKATVAVQDPAYPVYVDSSVMQGRFEDFREDTKQYTGMVYMPCHAENDFFPDLTPAKDSDIIMFCNPNNPTGACATRAQLQQLVDFARAYGKIIIYDAAYFAYIKDKNCPRTIYEIEGAREVAIETNSFSKLAGFTGVRLGWTVIPSAITYPDGSLAKNDFNRVFGTHFNGASNIALAGGLATLQNMDKVAEVLAYYQENSRIILATLEELGFQ